MRGCLKDTESKSLNYTIYTMKVFNVYLAKIKSKYPINFLGRNWYTVDCDLDINNILILNDKFNKNELTVLKDYFKLTGPHSTFVFNVEGQRLANDIVHHDISINNCLEYTASHTIIFYQIVFKARKVFRSYSCKLRKNEEFINFFNTLSKTTDLGVIKDELMEYNNSKITNNISIFDNLKELRLIISKYNKMFISNLDVLLKLNISTKTKLRILYNINRCNKIADIVQLNKIYDFLYEDKDKTMLNNDIIVNAIDFDFNSLRKENK